MGSDPSPAPRVLLDPAVWLSKSRTGMPLSRMAVGQWNLRAGEGVSVLGAAGQDSPSGSAEPLTLGLVPRGPV